MSRRHRSRHMDSFDAALLAGEEFIEPPAARRRRLDKKAKEGRFATEVDRSGSVAHLERAAKRLKTASAAERVLRVPQWDMPRAVKAMRKAGVSGVVSNLCGTRKLKVSPHKR